MMDLFKRYGLFLGCLGSMLLEGCTSSQEQPLFELLDAKTTGVDFRNDLVSREDVNILEYLYFYNGGGVAAGDINNDGLVDLYFTSNQGENKLYLNKGDFKFEDVTAQAGVNGGGGWSTGVTMADVNGDGFLDIYVCQVGDYKGIKGKNKLYLNNGDLTFREAAAEYGIDFVGFSTHALFFDYDQDGDLDLYLLNHSIKKPEVFSHADTKFTNQDEKGGDKLFKNLLVEGEQGMVEVTQEAGILSSSLGFGLGVGIADVNGDGWLDIYVSNDFTEDDYLYINQGNGTFVESLKTYIENTSRYSMGNDLADINNDGWPDIFTTDMLPENPEIWMRSVGEDKQEVYDVKKRLGYRDQYVRNHLQLNQGNGRFSEIALLSGVHATDWSWSPLIFDMDNDGLKDIHVTNGIVKRPNDLDFIQYSQEPSPGLSAKEVQQKQIEMLPTMKLSNYAFQNKGDFTFTDQAQIWGLAQPSYSNGSAYADLDNDGDLELIVNNIDQEAFIYRNYSTERLGNHFIQIDLQSDAGNSFGLGAEVWVFAQGQSFVQTMSTSRGFQSGTSTTLTFGLGKLDLVDSVKVIWDAKSTELFFPSAGARHLLVKGQGKVSNSSRVLKEAFFEVMDLGLDWTHEDNLQFDEFRREYLMPRRYATEGPALAVGDVNGDGLDDIFFGGAKGQAGVLLLQGKDGRFSKVINPSFEQLKMAEDVVAAFADLNGDGHLDLYVGSGGNEFPSGAVFNFDRVFINDGKGNLVFSMNALPPIGENTSTLAFHDINGDGALDIFVGTSIVAGNFGEKPRSFLLLNDGRGRFREVTAQYFGDDFRPGMVQNAAWEDLDGDGKKELLLLGEWMPIKVFALDSQGKMQEKSITEGPLHTFARGLKVQDITGDGLPDILIGNLGLNSKWKASEDKPMALYHVDVDGNSQQDPLVWHYMEELLVPFATRDDLIRQIPALKRKHKSYEEYAKLKGPEAFLEENVLKAADKYLLNELRSGYLQNLGGGKFSFVPFSLEAQFSPISDWTVFGGVGNEKYVLGVGNFHGFRTDLGKAGAQPFVLTKMENGKPETVRFELPSEMARGEIRRIQSIQIKGVTHWIAVKNNGKPVLFRTKN